MARHYLIVGNGPAGAAAAQAIRARDAGSEITIVGDEKASFYSRPGLAYLLAGSIPEGQLFSRPDEGNRRLGIRRVVARMERLEATEHRARLGDGRSLAYDRLLLAVGARALRPDVPGMDLEGVVTLDNLEDARRILRLARRARRAVVVGGGITALELAEGLAAQGVETHYLMRKDRYWGNVLEPEESTVVEARLEDEGIRLHHEVELKRVLDGRGRVSAVELSGGRRLTCDLLGVAIGIQPRLELAERAGLATKRGILTDEFFRTSHPDIYAAGDVAEVLDPASGQRVLDSLWSVATEQGRAAGANMAGAGEPYRRPVSFNVTRIGGVTTTLIGAVGSGRADEDLVSLSRGDSQSWRGQAEAFALVSEAGFSRVRVMVGKERIVGAVVMGDQSLSRPLQDLIRGRIDIRAARERLLRAAEDLPVTLTAIWKEAVGVAAG
jgi:NADPH-dependent 2,4-dienoyl-CoA reductase/sulfur reductase-like enzyme